MGASLPAQIKHASMGWKHPSSPSTRKFKAMPSAWKVMLTVFWDSQGVLLAHFQKRRENVNSASYCEVLLKRQDAICRTHPGQLARGVQLHRDNARPYTTEQPRRDFKNYGGNFLNIALQSGLGP
jgi:hypothetical protein